MHKIITLYKFHKIHEPLKLQAALKKELKNLDILGTIIVGNEGINGTVSGTNINLDRAIERLKFHSKILDLDLKESFSKKSPFLRLKIKIKDEIVTMGKKNINPSTQAGEYINHKGWNALIEDKNTLLIDTRNSYEYAIGTFKNSINPKTANFKEFPEWVNKQQFSETDKKQKKVAMFCTGGIRCEKASAFMKNEGFEKVYHLKGGILKYLEETETLNSLWQGECFVFDDRVSVKHDLSEGSYDLCHGCRMPITEQDKLSSHYVKGVSCSNCVNEKTSSQIKRYKTRQKQINLAKAKNKNHLGPKAS
tara:strand:- start:563 stop:1483 length:921 start_codon:yes stop_codon:yes gene_type:complete